MRRLRARWSLAALLIAAASPRSRRRNSAGRAPLRLPASWRRTPRRCRTTTPPIPACCGCSTAKRCGTSKTGAADKACADCHGDARASMKGVAARYPAFDSELGRPVDLEQRINLCRTQHQQASPFAYESRELLALTAFVAQQSRGDADQRRRRSAARSRSSPRGASFSCSGRASSICPAPIATTTIGTSASRASAITQAHPTGYPLYRLEWQSLGSLQRRLRGCIFGIRAQPYDLGAPELVELELYLMSRAGGMPIETPAVRP